MDCMDSVNWGNCLWFEGRSEKRNVFAGMISGLLVCSKKFIITLKKNLKINLLFNLK